MMKNIWNTLPKPFFILAPMEDVTDSVFRRIVLTCGRPDLMITEFTNVDGIFSPGREQVIKRFHFEPEEKPLIAQIWGERPENYFKAAQLAKEMGFDGIDINMGCPERRVIKQGVCSALMKNHSLAEEIILATQEGAESASRRIPISIKTRLGFNTIEIEDWIGFLLEHDLAALTVHGRTVKEMSEVAAHWDEIANVVKLCDQMKKDTLIIGNGDVMSREDGLQKIKDTGVDGIMIGRGIFHDPWLFNPRHFGEAVTFSEKLHTLAEHSRLFEATWGDTKPFIIMRKFVKCYVAGIPGAAEIRAELMTTQNNQELQEKIRLLLSSGERLQASV